MEFTWSTNIEKSRLSSVRTCFQKTAGPLLLVDRQWPTCSKRGLWIEPKESINILIIVWWQPSIHSCFSTPAWLSHDNRGSSCLLLNSSHWHSSRIIEIIDVNCLRSGIDWKKEVSLQRNLNNSWKWSGSSFLASMFETEKHGLLTNMPLGYLYRCHMWNGAQHHPRMQWPKCNDYFINPKFL